jgi:uncharacterized membrane protein
MTNLATPVRKSAPAKVRLRAPTMEDPWAWLTAGWRDLWKNPVLSFGYGATFVLIGLLATWGLWMAGLESMAPALAAGFTLVGPVFAIGLYEMSRKYEAGEQTHLRDVVAVALPSPAQMAFLAYTLMFLFLVWIRLATLNYAMFSYGDYRPLSEFVSFALNSSQGLTMIVVGTAIGAVIAFIAFALSVVSVPILMRHDIDVLSAMSISIKLVREHPGPMLLWAWLIGVLTLMGLASMFVGLALVFPLVGHATWHAYRSLIIVD